MFEKSAAEHLDRITIALDEASLARNCAHKSACRCAACILESGARESLTALRVSIAEMERHRDKYGDNLATARTALFDADQQISALIVERDQLAEAMEWAEGRNAELHAESQAHGRKIDELIVERDQARARSEALLTRKREMLGRIDSLEKAIRLHLSGLAPSRFGGHICTAEPSDQVEGNSSVEECECCGAVATKKDVEGVPLCDGCYEDLKRETNAILSPDVGGGEQEPQC